MQRLKPEDVEPLTLFALAIAGLVMSGVGANDRLTWLLEVMPVIVALPLLSFTYRSFPLTRLAYWLILFHAGILMLGGHYTYAQVPIGFWMERAFDFSRNHYDRIGHFVQGFVPAILAREILLRRSPLVPGKWLTFLTLCVCLAISASYEFIEWWTAEIEGSEATAFLATQGDPWDTQWDMLFALIGAIVAQLMLARYHLRLLARLDPVVHEKLAAD
jgi:putative membrane protein